MNMKKIKFDINKLRCFDVSPEHSTLLHRIPLREYFDRIISEGEDEVNVSPDIIQRYISELGNYKLRIFLGKDVRPPMIYVHINDSFAAQYSYFDDEKFAERSDIEDDD